MPRVVCDVCGKPTDRIVIKLFKSPTKMRHDHSDYTHHASIGSCCLLKINEINWNERKRRVKDEPEAEAPSL